MDKFLAVLAGIALIVIVGLFVGLPVMWLWNWLMPAIFGLPVIGFWQAVGLYILAGAFFKQSGSSK